MKKIISVSSIAILSSLTLLGFTTLAKAQSCIDQGVTMVCTDAQGNSATLTTNPDGSITITNPDGSISTMSVDSNGNIQQGTAPQ